MKKESFFPPGLEPTQKPCDYPACPYSGDYRAPKSREALTDYYWFCLNHVRQYNAAWDFLAGLTEEEIEAYIRRATVWEQPTWPHGLPSNAETLLRDALNKDFFGKKQAAPRHRPQNKKELEALAVLGLDQPTDFKTLKARYKTLVKKHHPDTNAGSAAAEAKIKEINRAFTFLKALHNKGKADSR